MLVLLLFVFANA